ncbi:response regulator transcription factor [Saccharothrix sp. NPDC042600]|uniref:response regulator transcription factor n=1 Tax=Saccharothrix TaxID=2071 RepID=UPI0033D62F75|nr:response regulator transcription factor [Saccharothrix mutabilis subsp. capreolus]
MNVRPDRFSPARAFSALVVEDDRDLAGALVRGLREAGFLARSAATALDGLRAVARDAPDVVVLDLGLPDLDGGEALRMLRGASDVPVVVATARGDELRIVQLLNNGADDYLVKPFSVAQLVARLGAVLRRTHRPGDGGPRVLAVGGLRVDLARREASLDGHPVPLNRKEFDLLAYLAENPDRVITRQELVAAVWGRPHTGREQSVDVHVSWLRRKLGETAAEPRYLTTVRGVGFRLTAPTTG